MHRLFVALRPPAAIRAGLLLAMGGVAAARWQDDDQLHLTMRFIGEVESPLADDIVAVLAGIAAARVEARIAGVGAFDNSLWAGLEPREPLAALHEKVDRALVRAGIAPDRRAYLPHITLARMPRSAATSPAVERWRAEHAGLASAPFPFDRLTLFESTLGRDGARYDAVVAWPLR